MMKAHRLKKKDADEHPKTLGFDVCERILWAIQNRNGYFFKDLARLCENPFPEKISLKRWLILMHWDICNGSRAGREQDHYFEVSELCRLAKQRGTQNAESLNDRRMREICSVLGIKFRSAIHKRGKRRISN